MIKLKGLSVSEFQNILQAERSIVCRGGGRALSNMLLQFPALLQKLKLIVDNGGKRELLLSGKPIPVCSVSEYEYDANSIHIITLGFYLKEMIEELDSLQRFDNCTFYIAGLADNDSALRGEILEKRECNIPKLIHYFWVGGNPLPDRLKRYIESWHKFCPDYEIKLWNEDNYDFTANKYTAQAYGQKKWGFCADYPRLDVIYRYGGIYLDTDVELVRNLDPLLKYNLFAGFEGASRVAFGLGFGATAGNAVIKKNMEYYESLSFVNEDGSLNLTPSPAYQSAVLEDLGYNLNNTTQIRNNSIILNSSYFAPVYESPVFSIHHYEGSWLDEETKERNTKIRDYKKVLAKRMEEEK